MNYTGNARTKRRVNMGALKSKQRQTVLPATISTDDEQGTVPRGDNKTEKGNILNGAAVSENKNQILTVQEISSEFKNKVTDRRTPTTPHNSIDSGDVNRDDVVTKANVMNINSSEHSTTGTGNKIAEVSKKVVSKSTEAALNTGDVQTVPGKATVVTKRRDCTVCRDQSQPPKLLPCMHTICAGCLQQHIDASTSAGSFPCPICRRSIPKPDNGARGFEDNIYTDTSVRTDVTCQACGERPGTHKCLECREIYCSACANIHVKMAPSKSHHVTTAEKHELISRPSPKMFCERHKQKNLGYYCADCQAVICGRCIIDTHQSHACMDVTEVAKQNRDELKDYLDSADTGTRFVTYLEKQTSEIRKAKTAFQNDVMNESTKIEQHAQKLKEKIDAAAKTLVANLAERERGIIERYDRASKESDAKLRWAKGTVKTIEQIVTVAGDSELVVKFPGMKKVLLDMRDQVMPTQFDDHVEATFVRASPSMDDMSRLLGTVEIQGSVKVNISTTMEFPSTDRLTAPAITAICPISDAEAWVVYDNVAQIVDKFGDKGMPLPLDDTVYDVAVHSVGTLILACNSCLKCLSENQKLYELFSLKNTPSGVAVLKDGGIVITFKVASLVSIYNLDGKQLKELNKKGGAKIIKEPYKVAINASDDVYVSEFSTGDIFIFSKVGQLKNTVSTAGILARAMAFDGRGGLLVADNSESVHLFTESGQYLQTLIPNKFKIISAVQSLGIDDSGDIWIGDTSGRVKIFYKLK